jgi:hypothetical protein
MNGMGYGSCYTGMTRGEEPDQRLSEHQRDVLVECRREHLGKGAHRLTGASNIAEEAAIEIRACSAIA